MLKKCRYKLTIVEGPLPDPLTCPRIKFKVSVIISDNSLAFGHLNMQTSQRGQSPVSFPPALTVHGILFSLSKQSHILLDVVRPSCHLVPWCKSSFFEEGCCYNVHHYCLFDFFTIIILMRWPNHSLIHFSTECLPMELMSFYCVHHVLFGWSSVLNVSLIFPNIHPHEVIKPSLIHFTIECLLTMMSFDFVHGLNTFGGRLPIWDNFHPQSFFAFSSVFILMRCSNHVKLDSLCHWMSWCRCCPSILCTVFLLEESCRYSFFPQFRFDFFIIHPQVTKPS